jgi:hypothetical protein
MGTDVSGGGVSFVQNEHDARVIAIYLINVA